MDGVALLWVICILMHDINNTSLLRSHNSFNSDNGNGSDLMVINATDINHLMRMAADDPGINTCDTSIGALIDERTLLPERGLQDSVVMRLLDLSDILVSVNFDFILLNLIVGCLCRFRQNRTNIP